MAVVRIGAASGHAGIIAPSAGRGLRCRFHVIHFRHHAEASGHTHCALSIGSNGGFGRSKCAQTGARTGDRKTQWWSGRTASGRNPRSRPEHPKPAVLSIYRPLPPSRSRTRKRGRPPESQDTRGIGAVHRLAGIRRFLAGRHNDLASETASQHSEHFEELATRMRDQVEISRKALVAQFRPKIVVRSIRFDPSSVEEFDQRTNPSWRIEISIVNVGDTVAHVTRCEAISFSNRVQVETVPCRYRDKRMGAVFFAAGRDKTAHSPRRTEGFQNKPSCRGKCDQENERISRIPSLQRVHFLH